ncbi:MAG: UDP-galactopyranose mutase [Lachnospiraceae bacterium]|nr:UDP-galactopyranose mutase [Lachnospiraceae bacterium]MBP1584301.1 UDP-galactopyranose mutase [Lachnospiraceae bacterium]
MRYDYLIVGAGLFGATFARKAADAGKKCLVIDKRDHIAGNIYTKEEHGIHVHKYGAHIFHTSDKKVWEYVNSFAEFNNFVNSPVARYGDELYNLPFNMNTFSKMWGISTPAEAKKIIDEQKKDGYKENPANLEEQAISLVGRDIYEKLIKGYTRKQWGRECTELPAFIIKRLPVRFTFDNNYFNDRYQGIPIGGYTAMVEKMLDGITVKLGVTYRDHLEANAASAEPDTYDRVIYTGPVDEYFGHKLGYLEYRSLRFEEEYMPDCDNFQGNAAVNYTSADVPYTRIIEHKHFEFGKGDGTVITREYPSEWKPGDEPYYPVNNDRNTALYEQYKELADAEENVIFGGRLGVYRYYDMDKVIASALELAEKELA